MTRFLALIALLALVACAQPDPGCPTLVGGGGEGGPDLISCPTP